MCRNAQAACLGLEEGGYIPIEGLHLKSYEGGSMGRRKGRRHNRAPVKMAAVNAHVTYRHHPRFYVGYGSNHNITQMYWRCPTADPVCAGILPDHRLVFSDVLTIEPYEGRQVPVSIWHVEPVDILALDRYEGYPHLYDKVYTHVTIDGTREEAFYYVMNSPYPVCPPGRVYEATVREGFRDWGFDSTPLDDAIAESWSCYSPTEVYESFDAPQDPRFEDYFEYERQLWDSAGYPDEELPKDGELDWTGPDHGGMIYGARDDDEYDEYGPYRDSDWMKKVVW